MDQRVRVELELKPVQKLSIFFRKFDQKSRSAKVNKGPINYFHSKNVNLTFLNQFLIWKIHVFDTQLITELKLLSNQLKKIKLKVFSLLLQSHHSEELTDKQKGDEEDFYSHFNSRKEMFLSSEIDQSSEPYIGLHLVLYIVKLSLVIRTI